MPTDGPKLPKSRPPKRRLISRPKLVREILAELDATGLTPDSSVGDLIYAIKEADFKDRF